MMSWKDLFTGTKHAVSYSRFRPTYPDELYTTLLSFLEKKLPGPHNLAIDVGCGSGQNSRALANYFTNVLATDISQAQIEEAVKAPHPDNVQYRVGNFDNLYADSGSADLVSSALAAHWFDPIERFYAEADRVLKPGGVLAVLGYGMASVHVPGFSKEQMTEPMWQVRRYRDMQPFVVDGNREIEQHYKHFNLPYPDWKRLDNMVITKQATLADFLGYISTWSFYQKFMETKPETDPLDIAAQRYGELVGKQSLQNIMCTVTFPVFLLIGHKP